MKKTTSKPAVLELLHNTPVIAAIKDAAGLEQCLAGDAGVVFILYGTVMDIPQITARLQDAGKVPFVHLDLVDGLAARDVAVDYIAQNTKAAGIITTKPALVRHAAGAGLLAVRRFFLLDSMALANLVRQAPADMGDFVEVLPGTMPKVIGRVAKSLPVPLIAGGLIADKDDVVSALSAGAVAISTTNPAVWTM